MNDNDHANNKSTNTKPSGFFERPFIIIAKAYEEDKSYEYNVLLWTIISLAIGVFAVFTWCLLGLVSIIISSIALINIFKNKRKGIVKWFAITGLGLGIINFAYYVIATVYFLLTY